MFLSRRSVRVKVMQVMYGRELGSELAFTDIEKILNQNLQNSLKLFIYNLFFITRIAAYSINDASIKAGKHLPTEKDKNISVKIFHNPIIQKLVNDEKFKQMVRIFKLGTLPPDDYCRILFQQLDDTSAYKNYILNENQALDEHKKIFLFLFRKVMLKSDLFLNHLDDLFSNWHDDAPMIENNLVLYFERIKIQVEKDEAKKQNTVLKFFDEDISKEKEFAEKLLNKIFYNDDFISGLITPKLENWDKDRVAQIDLILMKMALAEMLYFPEIPLKATVNEYIDIAKNYSTPKSGEFINGILDRLMKELIKKGLVKKEGRGLIEH